MKKRSLYTIFLTLALVLSACGSNDKEDGFNADGTPSSGEITTSLQTITIDKDSGNVVANVSVTSTYTNSAIANLSDMNILLGGCAMQLGTLAVSPESVILDTASPTKNVEFTGTMTDSSCVPTSYHLAGTNTLVQNAQTVEAAFTTDSVNIDANTIIVNDISLLEIEVLDKQLDINESSIEKPIRIRVTQGSIGIKNKKVKISSLVTEGSFLSASVLSDDAGDATFTYKAPNPMVDNNFTVQFCLEEDTTVCDIVNINLTTSAIVPPVDVIDDINYFITFEPNGGVYNLALDARNNAKINLRDKDTNESISSSRIKSVTVTSKDISVLKLTPEGGGTPVSSIVLGSGRNDVSVLMTADKFNSGLAPISIVIEYFNLNGILKTRGQLFSMAILSGAPTAFSINDNGVTYNAQTKQFEHKYIVQATDSSSNPISTTGAINVSAMASFAEDGAGREILYGRQSGGVSATLSPDAEKAELVLTGGLSPFNPTNISEDAAFIAVFGGPESYEAQGKWSITPGSLGGDTIKLNNIYSGGTHSNLGLAVGYNYREKFCSSAYEESVVVVDSDDGSYELNAKGQATVIVKHDAYMIGKRVMIMVNMTGLVPGTAKIQRTGEVHEDTLSFNEPLKAFSVQIPKSAVNFGVTIPGVIVAGGDEFTVLNSNFICRAEGDAGIISVNLVAQNDPASCDNGGRAFLRYAITANRDGGSVSFTECQVVDEPPF